ncbi:hypothetical protein IQ07DRAFT_620193 [Pyrenochaeta sp. DS3sAY3a]|nr:hypothetical protein IQ07DRAFT_620193 [Pyrenochaeta sp. DS3sAY3a]
MSIVQKKKFYPGPKDEVEKGVGMRYHVNERITGSAWLFEERETTLLATSMLLVRVMIAKVEDRNRCVAGWNCVGWVQEALQSVTEWTEVRIAAMEYCSRKKDEHRFDGQGTYDMTKAPRYDLVERTEKIPWT